MKHLKKNKVSASCPPLQNCQTDARVISNQDPKKGRGLRPRQRPGPFSMGWRGPRPSAITASVPSARVAWSRVPGATASGLLTTVPKRFRLRLGGEHGVASRHRAQGLWSWSPWAAKARRCAKRSWRWARASRKGRLRLGNLFLVGGDGGLGGGPAEPLVQGAGAILCSGKALYGRGGPQPLFEGCELLAPGLLSVAQGAMELPFQNIEALREMI